MACKVDWEDPIAVSTNTCLAKQGEAESKALLSKQTLRNVCCVRVMHLGSKAAASSPKCFQNGKDRHYRHCSSEQQIITSFCKEKCHRSLQPKFHPMSSNEAGLFHKCCPNFLNGGTHKDRALSPC